MFQRFERFWSVVMRLEQKDDYYFETERTERKVTRTGVSHKRLKNSETVTKRGEDFHQI